MQLVLALMALLALGPFLHAHYGSSRLTGFHVDGMGLYRRMRMHRQTRQPISAQTAKKNLPPWASAHRTHASR